MARYNILYRYNSFNIAGRKDTLPTKGLIREALSFINLLLTKNGRNGCTKGTVNVISTSGNALTKRALVRI